METKKGKIIGIAIGIIALVSFLALYGYQININDNGTDKKDNKILEDTGVYSGPLTILKSEYKLGENVYYIVNGLQPNEKGTIHFITPKGVEYKTVPYDGSKKTDFNSYFFPDTTAFLKVCSPEELVGTWKVFFDDGVYPMVEFEILDEYIPDEKNIERENIC